MRKQKWKISLHVGGTIGSRVHEMV